MGAWLSKYFRRNAAVDSSATSSSKNNSNSSSAPNALTNESELGVPHHDQSSLACVNLPSSSNEIDGEDQTQQDIRRLDVHQEAGRPLSPPPNCAICFEACKNKCFIDSCMHQFCRKCLCEWSKVKPECPLCKQTFKSIIYNVKSGDQYDVASVLNFSFDEEENNESSTSDDNDGNRHASGSGGNNELDELEHAAARITMTWSILVSETSANPNDVYNDSPPRSTYIAAIIPFGTNATTTDSIDLNSSSSEDCEFVLARQPPNLRTPELISLHSDTDSDVVPASTVNDAISENEEDIDSNHKVSNEVFNVGASTSTGVTSSVSHGRQQNRYNFRSKNTSVPMCPSSSSDVDCHKITRPSRGPPNSKRGKAQPARTLTKSTTQPTSPQAESLTAANCANRKRNSQSQPTQKVATAGPKPECSAATLPGLNASNIVKRRKISNSSENSFSVDELPAIPTAIVYEEDHATAQRYMTRASSRRASCTSPRTATQEASTTGSPWVTDERETRSPDELNNI